MSYPNLVGGGWLARSHCHRQPQFIEADRRRRRKFGGGITLRIGSGANLAFSGKRLQRKPDGYYLSPALFTETSNDMTMNREETFGPVENVVRVRDYERVLAVANDTPIGLTAGTCTFLLDHATHFRRNAQAGMVMVDLPTAGVDYYLPFGGSKHQAAARTSRTAAPRSSSPR